MMGLLRLFRRDLFRDLPEINVPSARWGDEDRQAWSDILYMRDLVDDIERLVDDSGDLRRIETILARPTIDDQDIPAVSLVSPVEHDIVAWRSDTAGLGLAFTWWLLLAQKTNRDWIAEVSA